MIYLKLSSIDAHPREIFKALEDLKAERDWARRPNAPIPKCENIKKNANWYKLIKSVLNECKP